MNIKRAHWFLLGGVVAVAALVFALSRRAPRTQGPSPSALDIVPSGAAFLLSVNVTKLRTTPLVNIIAQESRQGFTNQVQTLCGFDPLLLLSNVVIAVPGNTSPADQDFALIARGTFSVPRITSCASKLIEQRGGSVVRTQIGSFATVRDRKHPAGEVAVTKQWLIVGGGNYLRELLDIADRKTRGTDAHPFDELHAALRSKVGVHKPIVASCVLPPGFFEDKFGKEEVQGSPLTELRAAALALELQQHVTLDALLGCANPAGCAKIEDFVRETVRELKPTAGRGPSPSDVQIQRADSEIRIRTQLTYEKAFELFSLLEF